MDSEIKHGSPATRRRFKQSRVQGELVEWETCILLCDGFDEDVSFFGGDGDTGAFTVVNEYHEIDEESIAWNR